MPTESTDTFTYLTEKFAEFKVARCRVPGFEELPLKQKTLLYYLSEAALAGRDITWDQNYKHNLYIRRILETIVSTYTGDRGSESFKNFLTYVKRVWMSNGIHHVYSADKMFPDITEAYFAELVKGSDAAKLPLGAGETLDDLIATSTRYIFDRTLDTKRVSLDKDTDVVMASSNNFYEGVTAAEVEAFYANVKDEDPTRPVSHGLNSKMVKENGVIREVPWKIGGMYSAAIEKIVFWLTKALDVTETPEQRVSLEKLITFYTTGDLKAFDEYSVQWLRDATSDVDVISGFIEVYEDAVGKRGSYQSLVSIRDPEATKRIRIISDNADWFEQHSPIDEVFKKPHCKGMVGSSIYAVMRAGDVAPLSPVGVNLPNAEWIKEELGSKSISLDNLVMVYDILARESGVLQEFAYTEREVMLQEKYGVQGSLLHTVMHEVIGHGSGQLKEGVTKPGVTLKNYYMTLEEARADLVALYYGYDQKLVDLGVMESLEVGEAEYDAYIRGAFLTQLARVEYGKDLAEAHMRNRQLVAGWCYEHGKKDNVIERTVRDGKTYFFISDYQKLRTLIGELLREIQRIKSEGDFDAGRDLVETYGVKVDRELHKEVLERWAKLNSPPFTGFINPKLTPIYNGDTITDVTISYPMDFAEQMLEYGREYGLLPVKN